MAEQRADRAGSRAGLDRATVVAAAITLVEADGVAALSMRRLGAALGVEAMALYRYVHGREDLLEAIVDTVTARVERAADMDLGPHGGWQAYLQRVAHAVRDIAVDHPNVFPLVVTRHPAAPWLRPPLRNLDVVEDFLATLTSFGFPDEEAVAAYRMFTGFLLGHLLLGVAERGASTVPTETLDEGGATVPTTPATDLREYPTLLRLRAALADGHADEDFEAALENLLERIEAMVAQ